MPTLAKYRLGAYAGAQADVTQIQAYESAAYLNHAVSHNTVFPGSDTWNHITGATGVAYTYWSTGAGSAYRDKSEIAIHMLPSSDAGDPSPTLALGAAGSYDSKWTTFANTLISKGYADTGTVIVRLGWEFSGDWNADSIQTGGVLDAQKAADYVTYWQRIVDICRNAFTAAGKPGVRWCWSPARDQVDPTPAYPGDTYVDIVGISFYNSLTQWSDYLAETYGINWQVSFAAAHSKPCAISEWGLKSATGDDPTFIQNVFDFCQDNNYEYWQYFDSGDATLRTSATYPNARARFLTLYSDTNAAAANLTAGGSTSALTSYATASITPSANKLQLLAVHTKGASDSLDPPAPTSITGNGLAWTLARSHVYDQGGAVHMRVDLYVATGAAPATGAITISYGAYTPQGCTWTVDELGGVDLSAGALAAIVQSAVGGSTSTTPTSGSVTLAAFASSTNVTYAAVVLQANQAVTPGTGFTQLGSASVAEPLTSSSEFLAGNDTTVDASWAAGSAWGILAVEIKSSTSAPVLTKTRERGFVFEGDAIASTTSLDGATWQQGFLRAPDGTLVVSAGPGTYVVGFIRDANGALVVVNGKSTPPLYSIADA